ncbi:MAG: ferritin-like domain-containing protein [bacterium]
MIQRARPHAEGRIRSGDCTQRVSIEQMQRRGVNVQRLAEKLTDAAASAFVRYYHYLNLRAQLAGLEDYKAVCEKARRRAGTHFEWIAPRLYELSESLPTDMREFMERASCPEPTLPRDATPADLLEVMLESERCAVRTWNELCDLTLGKDPRTYELAARILSDVIEHEAWCVELLSMERDGVARPSGQVAMRHETEDEGKAWPRSA